VSLKISAYLRGLKLSGTVEERVRDDHLKASPLKKNRSQRRIRFDKVVVGGVWGNLHANNDSSATKGGPSPSSTPTPTPTHISSPSTP